MFKWAIKTAVLGIMGPSLQPAVLCVFASRNYSLLSGSRMVLPERMSATKSVVLEEFPLAEASLGDTWSSGTDFSSGPRRRPSTEAAISGCWIRNSLEFSRP